MKTSNPTAEYEKFEALALLEELSGVLAPAKAPEAKVPTPAPLAVVN